MIRVIMFDLGGTLVDGQRPFPHVPDALGAVNGFETADGQPLRSCLVSDFTMAEPPDDPAHVEAIFADYLALLAGFGLTEFFRPPQERITLSTHAGVRKPDRRVYETALRRLGSPAGLPECLVVTEDAAHLAACRDLGMSTLRFNTGDDWLDVLLRLRLLVAPTNVVDGAEALRPWFAVRDAELISVAEPISAGEAAVRLRVPVSGPDGRPATRLVDTLVSFDDDGRVLRLTGSGTDQETAAFVASLRAAGALGVAGGPLMPGVTHTEAIGESGEIVARRRRFSAM